MAYILSSTSMMGGGFILLQNRQIKKTKRIHMAVKSITRTATSVLSTGAGSPSLAENKVTILTKCTKANTFHN